MYTVRRQYFSMKYYPDCNLYMELALHYPITIPPNTVFELLSQRQVGIDDLLDFCITEFHTNSRN